MDEQLKAVMNLFSGLSREKKRKLKEAIDKELEDDEKIELLEIEEEVDMEGGKRCPHCNSKEVVGHGKYKERKRYRCKECGKTFNDLTGTPMNWSHYSEEQWIRYLKCMLEGKPLRKIAEELNIALRTAFIWRHKILTAFKDLDFDKLEGIAEVDDTYFLYSEKGSRNIEGRGARKRGGRASKRGISNEQVAVISGCDRKGNVVLDVACRGRISEDDAERILGKYIDKENTICSDKHRSYEAFATDKNIEFEPVNISKGQRIREKIFHVQNVNSLHSRLKKWIGRFHGVATKYLSNYTNWFWILEKAKDSIDELKEITKYVLRGLSKITEDQIGNIRPQSSIT